MSLNLDRSFFSVICELGKSLYAPETELEEMELSRIVGDIRSGQFENVQAILEFNPVEGWCNDITGDVLAMAFPRRREADDGEENWSDYSSERLDARLAGVHAAA